MSSKSTKPQFQIDWLGTFSSGVVSSLAHNSWFSRWWQSFLPLCSSTSYWLNLYVGVERISVHFLYQLLLLLLLEPIELDWLVGSANLISTSYNSKIILWTRDLNLVGLEGIRGSHRIELVLQRGLQWIWVLITLIWDFGLFDILIIILLSSWVLFLELL